MKSTRLSKQVSRIVVVLFALFYSFNLSSQVSEQYFSEGEIREGSKVEVHLKYRNTILIGGSSWDKTQNNPSILCIDTGGNVLWNTGLNDTGTYEWGNNYVYRMMMGNDSFVYAVIRRLTYSGPGYSELWKVNLSNGLIVWRKKFSIIYSTNSIGRLVDYDSTKFIVSYPASYTFNGNKYDTRAAFVNKLTGDTLSTFYIGTTTSPSPGFGLCVDNKQNIYYSFSDTIYKVSGLSPHTKIWKQRHASAKASSYDFAYYDTSSSSLFYFGRANVTLGYGLIVKINPTSGAFISNHITTASDVAFREMKVYNGYIYVAWRHIYVGGFSPIFAATKYNMSAGTSPWTTFRAFPGGGMQAAMSLDLDNSENLYLTGYYKDANYGPANWGIIKIDGKTGDTIYTRRIAKDYNIDDELSSGMGACMINNQPYFVGQMETNHNFFENMQNSAATFVKIEPSTGNTLIKKSIYGLFQYPSTTLSIKNYPNSKTLVLKQVGKEAVIEMYDSLRKQIWTQQFSKGKYFIGGGDVSVSPANDDIYISAYSQGESPTTPSYSTFTDSIFVYHLNDSGRTLKKYSFFSGSYNCLPVELYTDNVSTILFYSKSGVIYYRKIASSTLSSEYNSQVSFNPTFSRTKYAFNTINSKTLLFGKKSSATRMTEIDKNSMAIKNISILPQALSNLNYVFEIDPFRVALCGKDNLNRESLGVYNLTTKDTVWTKILSSDTGSEVLKCASDPTKKFLYSISHRASNIIIRKHDILNGQLKWTYTFNGNDSLDDCPIDISFDAFRNHLIVTGYETGKNNKKALILVLDSAGKLLTKISKDGDFKGSNIGICTQVLYEGTRWVGGNLNKNNYRLAGFIYEIGECKTNPSSISPISCLQYKSPSGKYTWNTSGVYSDTVKNVSGCDSAITINLTIGSNSASSISPTSCNTYKSPSGKYTWTASGTYKDTIANSIGCDSVITVNLTIGNFSTSSVSPAVCKSYKSPSGKYTWTQSGTYLDSTKTISGCDSIITVNLTINKTNTGVTVTNNVLMANATSAIYKWYDCKNKLPISGANAQQFSPTVNGDYAVIITQNNCTDTSACYPITNVGVDEGFIGNSIKIYPNPSKSQCTITSTSGFENATLKIINYTGQTLLEKKNLEGNSVDLDVSGLNQAVYFIEVENNGNISRIKLIKL